jgi:hypothetical protein
VRTLAYKQIAYLDLTCGEYRTRCGCCRSFRTSPEGVLPKHAYDNKVRQAVLDLILDSRLNVEATRHALRRDFLLDLSTGFVYDCLHAAVREVDGAAYRREVLRRFSGTLCVDEIHLGSYTLLLATDPLGDFPVAFALVKSNDQAHMGRFLGNLKNWGLTPQVVVTDGSNLYPTVLAELWPQAEHQLCVFHVLQDLNGHVLDAVKRLRRLKAKQGAAGRKGGKGRRPKGGKGRRPKGGKGRRPKRGPKRRRGPTAKEKAHFVFKKRHLLVKRRDKLTAAEKKELAQALEYIPALRVLRRFVDRVHRLLADGQSEAQAWRKWKRLQGEKAFQAVPELAAALAGLREEKFGKVIAFLRRPVGQRVRTNNHVERVNRQLRYWEKVRYKWRRRRSLVRFVILVVARLREQAFQRPPAEEATAAAPARPAVANQPAQRAA